MKIKKAILTLTVTVIAAFTPTMNCFATAGTEPLQAYFTDDGRTMKVFTSSPLDENASILIGNETLEAVVQNSDVQVNTIFLIDNSTSMPYSLRDEVKNAITDYVSVMPANEKVKIAMFDTQTTILADEYSNDREFINYELSKVDFNGQASLIYDAVMNAANAADNNQDIYYRTVLITDGVDSIEGTSFDYMRTYISENGRYHVDVVQVSVEDRRDVNLTAIGNLGSNTYTLFNSGTKFDHLKPENVSMLKAELSNGVTTGELKGVTIKNSDSNISLGSILFPQVEIPTIAETTLSETSTKATTTKATTSATTTTTTMDDERKDNPSLWILLLSIGGLFAVAAVFLIIWLKKRSRICNLSVHITKDDERDKKGIGNDVWSFSTSSEFRVGRTLEPISNDKTPMPVNHRAICEDATNDDISSIGRNAFSLTYDKKADNVTIKNIAQGAMFSVETDGRRSNLRSGQSAIIKTGSKILLGNYTTITINDITVNKR